MLLKKFLSQFIFIFIVLSFILTGCSSTNLGKDNFKIYESATINSCKEKIEIVNEKCKNYKNYMLDVYLEYDEKNRIFYISEKNLDNLIYNIKFLQDCINEYSTIDY